jgi:hypothetical protein
VTPAEVGGMVGEEAMRPAVQAVAGQQVIPGAQDGQQRRRHRRHAGRRGDGRFGALQRGQFVVQVPLGRRGAQPEVGNVVVAGAWLDRVHGALTDRKDHRALGSQPRFPAVNRQGLHRFGIRVHADRLRRSPAMSMFVPLLDHNQACRRRLRAGVAPEPTGEARGCRRQTRCSGCRDSGIAQVSLPRGVLPAQGAVTQFPVSEPFALGLAGK